jgi:hypothetical protein
MRSGRAEESGASTARGGLISCALTIGIATMRKRKLRTALTGITVALITFALLSFSSTSKIKEFSRYELGGEAAYTGVLVQEPGKGPLNEQTVKVVRRAAGTNAVVAARRWLALSANDQQWRLHVRIPGTDRDVVMKAALALTPEDREVGGLDRWLPDWDGFVASGGCYLPPAKAEALGVKPGDSLTVAGMPYTFTGTFDPVVFRDRLRMLNGDPMMPLDYAAIEDNEQAVLQNMTLEDAARGMLTGESRTSEDFLDPAEMALVLGAEDVPGLTLHAVELREPSAEAAEATAISLAQQLDYPVFYSSGSGISVLAAAPLVPRPPRSMLIPLLVAGLIIFNTMLNSIAERRKEIHVYTSLGLAPVHIGSIFMAEALTYGLMGGMFGYVAGQGMATVFSKLGWMGDITLNYSGTQVIYTMLLVLAVVVVSALIPAAMAARLASPSKETGWHLPAPDGDRIHDVLPFTVTPQAAGGILAFLYEHFDAHREGSIGDFSCADLAFAAADDCPEGCLGTLRATVWLAPYDLGVRQDVVVRILQSDEDVCDVHLDLHRRAGQPRSWHKLNRVFVGGLRRQILGWRNISASRVLAYIAMAAGGMRERPAIPAFEGMDEDVASS